MIRFERQVQEGADIKTTFLEKWQRQTNARHHLHTADVEGESYSRIEYVHRTVEPVSTDVDIHVR